MKPVAQLAACAALAVAVAGCDVTYTQQPSGAFTPTQVVLATPGGLYPLGPSATQPTSEPSLAALPGFFGLGSTALPNPAGGWQDGTYDGTATLLQDDLGDCPFHFAMSNVHLTNGRARFGGFHGTVGPDGGVRMADGAMNWITGRFTGGTFSGFYSNRLCAYSLSLDRAGP